MIQELFKTIDERDSEGFAGFLSPDCIFRFGNAPEVKGRENVKQAVAGFFASIKALSHELETQWETPEGVGCHGTVTYWRKDGSSLTVPFANIFETDSNGIRRYLIFTDASSLYEKIN